MASATFGPEPLDDRVELGAFARRKRPIGVIEQRGGHSRGARSVEERAEEVTNRGALSDAPGGDREVDVSRTFLHVAQFALVFENPKKRPDRRRAWRASGSWR